MMSQSQLLAGPLRAVQYERTHVFFQKARARTRILANGRAAGWLVQNGSVAPHKVISSNSSWKNFRPWVKRISSLCSSQDLALSNMGQDSEIFLRSGETESFPLNEKRSPYTSTAFFLRTRILGSLCHIITIGTMQQANNIGVRTQLTLQRERTHS